MSLVARTTLTVQWTDSTHFTVIAGGSLVSGQNGYRVYGSSISAPATLTYINSAHGSLSTGTYSGTLNINELITVDASYDQYLLDSTWGLGSGGALSCPMFYPMDDAAHSSTFREASGSGHFNAFPFSGSLGFATLGNASIVPGSAATCLHKSTLSNDSYAYTWSSIPAGGQSDLQTTGPFAYTMWWRPDEVTGDNNGHQYFGGQWTGKNIFEGGRTTSLAISGVSTHGTGSVLVPNNPYHLVWAYDGSFIYVYVNGTLQDQSAVTGTPSASTSNLEIGGIIGLAGCHGFMQKWAYLLACPSQAQVQSLYMRGAAGVADMTGVSMNVYQFSRQVVAQNNARRSIALTNDGDSVIYLALGDTNSPAAKNNGVRLNPNGGRWSSAYYQGPVQAVHSSFLGARTLLVEEA